MSASDEAQGQDNSASQKVQNQHASESEPVVVINITDSRLARIEASDLTAEERLAYQRSTCTQQEQRKGLALLSSNFTASRVVVTNNTNRAAVPVKRDQVSQ